MGNQVRIGTQVTGVGKSSNELDKLRDRFEKLQKQGAKGVGIGVGVAAGTAALNLLGEAAGMAADAVGDAIDAASDLNESMTLGQQVFEGNSAAIEDWAAGAADAFGQSKREALNFASNFGTAFKNVGMSLDDTTDKAEAMTELAADLGSAFNASSEEAATALRSGLLGESEPLRRFGVFLDEAKTKNKALAMGMKATNGVFTDGQKVAARYALILEQTADSQGMFGRDANSLADTQKSVAAQMENVTAAIGQRLLPIVLELAKGVRDNLVPAVETASTVVGALGNVVDAAVMVLDPFAYAMRGAKEDAERLRIEGLEKLNAQMLLANPTMHTYSERVDAIAGASREAADAVAEIPPPAIFTRRELAKLAQEFKDTARAARDNRLDEAYDIAELPIKIREAKREVKDAQKELEEARTAAQRDAATLRLLEAQRDLENLRHAMADKTEGFAALGHLLGTAYGRALFQAVAAWNRRTSNIPLPNPRYGGSTRNIDRNEGKAAGGPASGVTLVGEKGPEIVDLPPGSFVHSNAESTRMAASLPTPGGGVTNFYVTANLSPTGYSPAQAEQIANAVGPAIATYLRRRGLLVN